MKRLFITLGFILFAGCYTTGPAYLPHTSTIFHAKKDCPGCKDLNPIVLESVQDALKNRGITPCGICVKDRGIQHEGYKVYDYSGPKKKLHVQ